jgi:protein SCO1
MRLLIAFVLTLAGLAHAHAADEPTLSDRVGAQVPGELVFRDSEGLARPLSDIMDGRRPVVLTLVYYNCPSLCTAVLNGLIDAVRGLSSGPGEDFQMITVSIDAREEPALAAAKKTGYLTQLGRPNAAGSWHFFVGDRVPIRSLADTLGFGFRYDPDTLQYIHPGALFVLSPDGQLKRTLHGAFFAPETLRLALAEARGDAATTADRLRLLWLRYDAAQGDYRPAVGRVLLAVLAGLLLLTLGLVAVLRRRAGGES